MRRVIDIRRRKNGAWRPALVLLAVLCALPVAAGESRHPATTPAKRGAPAASATPWLSALGRRTVVCVGPNAPAPTRAAAQRVVDALKAVNPDARLLDADALAVDYDTMGTRHVVCVGEWPDNQVLRMTWGYWATTKARREWEAAGDKLAIEALNLWEKNIPPQEWRDGHDLFAFGYGEFDGNDVGYVQTVRNPFPILLRAVPGQTVYNADVARVNDKFPRNQMFFMVHLSGTGPAGVAGAVDAFLKDGLLNGVVAGARGPAAKTRDWTLEKLGPDQLARDLPAWFPTTQPPAGLRYLGLQMPGSHLYGGFEEASGQRPKRCWRLKYALESGFVLFPSYPTNRASGNELFIAEMDSPASAQVAAEKLAADLAPEPDPTLWEFGGHTYALYAGEPRFRKSFEDAKAFCEAQGGHLVTITSKEEQDAMGEVLRRQHVGTVYLGLTGDWRTDEWQWITGEPFEYRGWRVIDGRERFGVNLDQVLQRKPEGPYAVVHLQQSDPWGVGWYLADAGQHDALSTETSYFVCEWDRPQAAPKPPERRRVAARGNFVLLNSFDDPAGDALMERALDNRDGRK